METINHAPAGRRFAGRNVRYARPNLEPERLAQAPARSRQERLAQAPARSRSLSGWLLRARAARQQGAKDQPALRLETNIRQRIGRTARCCAGLTVPGPRP